MRPVGGEPVKPSEAAKRLGACLLIALATLGAWALLIAFVVAIVVVILEVFE